MMATKLYLLFIGIALISNVAIAQDVDSDLEDFLSAEDGLVPSLSEEVADISEADVIVTEAPEELAPLIVEEEPLPTTDEPAELEEITEAPTPAPTFAASTFAASTFAAPTSAAPAATPAPPKKTNGGEFVFSEGNMNNFFVFTTSHKGQGAGAAEQPDMGFESILAQQLLDQVNKITNVETQTEPQGVGAEKLDEIKHIQEELRTLLENAKNVTQTAQAQAAVQVQAQEPQTSELNNLAKRLVRAMRVFYPALLKAVEEHGSNLSDARKVLKEAVRGVYRIIRMLMDVKIKTSGSVAAVLQNTAAAFNEE